MIGVVSPLGSFLTMLDGPLQLAVQAGSQAIRTWVAPVAFTMAGFYYLMQGIRWANGDASVARNFIPQMMRIVFILTFITSAPWFNKWVIGLLYIGLPQAMTAAISGTMGANVMDVSPGVSNAAAAFDQIWNLIGHVVGTVWSHAGPLDFTVWFSGVLTLIGCGICLGACALVYFLSRLLFAVLIIFGGVIIACGLAETTRSIMDRALGKSLSLVLLQVSAIVVLEILLFGDQQFMQAVIGASAPLGPVTPGQVQGYFAGGGTMFPATATEMQNLTAMVLWFGAAAFTMLSLPALAYSLGGGIMTSALPALIGAGAAARYLGRIPGSGGGGGASYLPPGNWNVGMGQTYDVSLRRDQIASGSAGRRAFPPQRMIPPPPPPPFAPRS